MKYILVQFQGGKDKPFSGKFYIYKYDDSVITYDFAKGDILKNLESTSGYKYRNNAIVDEVFNNYSEYHMYCKWTRGQEPCNKEDIKTLLNIEVFKRNFRPGDLVKVHKPSMKNNELFSWTPGMDEFNNTIQEIKLISFRTDLNIPFYCQFKDDPKGFSFDLNWLELVSEKDLKTKESFKCGDWVIIHKPNDVNEYPYWRSDMNDYDNTIQNVESVGVYEKGIEYFSIFNSKETFNVNWAEKYKEPNFKVGDKVKIHRPKNKRDYLYSCWEPEMDCFDQKVSVIKEIHPEVKAANIPTEYELNISNGYYFLGCWLEKVNYNEIDNLDKLKTSKPISSSSVITCYEPVPAQLAVQGTNLPFFYEGFTTKINEIKESEGNKMDFSNILNVEFGKINDSHDVAASMYGIAIRGNDNRYRAYDKANGKIIDVTGMTFNTDMLFKIPCAISQISVGDVIINAGNYVTVTNVHKDGTFTVVDPRASEQKIAIPAKNMFGFDFMTKVFYPLDSFIKPTDDNPFGLNPMAMMLLASDEDIDMSTLVLMTMMGNGATNQNMMLPMILMMNKNGRSSDMSTLALAMMMGQTNTLDMSNRRKYTYKHRDASKEVESYRRALETSPVPEPIYDDVSDVPDAINPCAD